eukprot:CAMPEP_0176005036 /NCGR_PEP_ID=MMETSP0120_2-20121206/1999_1 /TAXON_ID=160619 /ORGANISM="Kryptoperidinium foliaceum, Strain CCMP 1326" /LENGTH=226 /DNA_ID=CAMNT_0017337731 /DNA_START=117 /DNA_END=793 /DNA_ORIENTATION=-
MDRVGGVLGESSADNPDSKQADTLGDSEEAQGPEATEKQKKSTFTKIKHKARKLMKSKSKGSGDADDETSPESYDPSHDNSFNQVQRQGLEETGLPEDEDDDAEEEEAEPTDGEDENNGMNTESAPVLTAEEKLDAALQSGELEDTITGRRLRRRRQSLAKETEIPETPRRGRVTRRLSKNLNGEMQPDFRNRAMPGAEELLGAKRNLRRTPSNRSDASAGGSVGG